jgi:hypothetical protein
MMWMYSGRVFMRTQTTLIRPPGRTNFDLDIVVALSWLRHQNPDPERLFQDFGEPLKATNP